MRRGQSNRSNSRRSPTSPGGATARSSINASTNVSRWVASIVDTDFHRRCPKGTISQYGPTGPTGPSNQSATGVAVCSSPSRAGSYVAFELVFDITPNQEPAQGKSRWIWTTVRPGLVVSLLPRHDGDGRKSFYALSQTQGSEDRLRVRTHEPKTCVRPVAKTNACIRPRFATRPHQHRSHCGRPGFEGVACQVNSTAGLRYPV